MKAPLHRACAWAFVGMTAAFAAWSATVLPIWLGLVAALPLIVCAGGVFRSAVRPLVVAGAIALPYLAVIIVEIIATRGRAPALIAALACGVMFMTLLVPVTRNAKLAALSLRK